MGLAFDEWDLDYYTRLFKDMGRDPTNVELFDIAQVGGRTGGLGREAGGGLVAQVAAGFFWGQGPSGSAQHCTRFDGSPPDPAEMRACPRNVSH
jgi:hypothetical protein